MGVGVGFHPGVRVFDVGARMKWWVLFFVGAGLTLTPGYLNPFSVVNGMTLVGVGLLLWSAMKIAEGSK